MIGVSADPVDLDVAAEFFELFKTPWEPVVPERKYRVVLCTNERIEGLEAELLLLYSSGEKATDRDGGIGANQTDGPVDVEWEQSTFPIYGRIARFDADLAACTLKSGNKALDCRRQTGGRLIWRIGYDLFREIRYLLTEGQPAPRALTPTLELHIALLRHLLLESGIPFVEIPPRPDGYDFICCLTHDVDFSGIRRHTFDRTLAGFVARASLGTLADLVRGRRSLGEAGRNWGALLSLPLVFLRLLPDFWRPFDDYGRVEGGHRSTFFLLPFKGQPGLAPDGTVDAGRAAPYQISEIGKEAKNAAKLGSELAVHGIDAWRDADAGRAEMSQLTSLTGQETSGVRMHWLYFDTGSPRRLEAAGFDYDSTWGYNDAVGYRAGTSQVFRWPASENFMELPMSVMDSALFYPGRMGLAHEEAWQRCVRIVATARHFAGTLVINWHDRSLAPERLWGRFYRKLLEEVTSGSRVWFATGRDAVGWFRWRRSIRFTLETSSGVVTVAASAPHEGIPAGGVRIHRPTGTSAAALEERRFDGHEPMRLEMLRS